MESLQQRLERKGLRVSIQRLKILQYLDQHRVHPTVDDIYGALKKEMPSISKTTIYNTLDVLHKAGLVSCLTISPKEVRFDAEPKAHPHFFCLKCNRVLDLEEVICPHIKSHVDGNIVEEVHLYFKGICKKCKGGE